MVVKGTRIDENTKKFILEIIEKKMDECIDKRNCAQTWTSMYNFLEELDIHIKNECTKYDDSLFRYAINHHIFVKPTIPPNENELIVLNIVRNMSSSYHRDLECYEISYDEVYTHAANKINGLCEISFWNIVQSLVEKRYLDQAWNDIYGDGIRFNNLEEKLRGMV